MGKRLLFLAAFALLSLGCGGIDSSITSLESESIIYFQSSNFGSPAATEFTEKTSVEDGFKMHGSAGAMVENVVTKTPGGYKVYLSTQGALISNTGDVEAQF